MATGYCWYNACISATWADSGTPCGSTSLLESMMRWPQCAYGNKLRHAPILASHIPSLCIGLGTRLAKSGHMTLGTPPSGRPDWSCMSRQELVPERVKAAKQNDGKRFLWTAKNFTESSTLQHLASRFILTCAFPYVFSIPARQQWSYRPSWGPGRRRTAQTKGDCQWS